MRALIIASASLDTVMAPSSTWVTNSFTRFLPRSRADGSRAKRPSSTIWSSRLCSAVCEVAPWAAAAFWTSLIGPSVQTQFGAQPGEFVLIADGVTQQLFQLVVALHAAAEIA